MSSRVTILRLNVPVNGYLCGNFEFRHASTVPGNATRATIFDRADPITNATYQCRRGWGLSSMVILQKLYIPAR